MHIVHASLVAAVAEADAALAATLGDLGARSAGTAAPPADPLGRQPTAQAGDGPAALQVACRWAPLLAGERAAPAPEPGSAASATPAPAEPGLAAGDGTVARPARSRVPPAWLAPLPLLAPPRFDLMAAAQLQLLQLFPR